MNRKLRKEWVNRFCYKTQLGNVTLQCLHEKEMFDWFSEKLAQQETIQTELAKQEVRQSMMKELRSFARVFNHEHNGKDWSVDNLINGFNNWLKPKATNKEK